MPNSLLLSRPVFRGHPETTAGEESACARAAGIDQSLAHTTAEQLPLALEVAT